MANVPQIVDQATQDTPAELLELMRAIDALPAQHRAALQPALNRVVDSSSRRRRILSMVQPRVRSCDHWVCWCGAIRRA